MCQRQHLLSFYSTSVAAWISLRSLGVYLQGIWLISLSLSKCNNSRGTSCATHRLLVLLRRFCKAASNKVPFLQCSSTRPSFALGMLLSSHICLSVYFIHLSSPDSQIKLTIIPMSHAWVQSAELLNEHEKTNGPVFFFFFFFFFFFCVPQLYLWGSPLLGEIFAYVTVF